MSTFGDLRSILSKPRIDTYAVKCWVKDTDNPDHKISGILMYLNEKARRVGEDPRTIEFSMEIRVRNRKGYRTSEWHHGKIDQMAELFLRNLSMTWGVRTVRANRILKPGMEISSYINGDSYGCIITKVDTQKKIWVADLKSARRQLNQGVDLKDISSRCYTRRQKRDSGKRGWAVKGSSIKSISNSGLNFNGAVDRLDPHF